MVTEVRGDPDDRMIHVWCTEQGLAIVLHGLLEMADVGVVPDAPTEDADGRWSFAYFPDSDLDAFYAVTNILVKGALHGPRRPF